MSPPGIAISIIALRRSIAAFDDAVFDRHARVENADLRVANEGQQSVGVRIAHRKIDLDGHIAREFEEMLFVKHAVTPEARDRAKCGAAVDPQFLRLLEQPLVEQDVVVLAILVHIKAQQRPFHRAPQWKIARIASSPSIVIASDPITCAPMPNMLHSHSRRSISVEISPENVENVVKPPRNPVVTMRRASGDSKVWRVMSSIANPIRRPPNRLATSVPSGSVGKTGLRTMLKPQRIHAPTAAPPPTASTPAHENTNTPGRIDGKRPRSARKAIDVVRVDPARRTMSTAHRWCHCSAIHSASPSSQRPTHRFPLTDPHRRGKADARGDTSSAHCRCHLPSCARSHAPSSRAAIRRFEPMHALSTNRLYANDEPPLPMPWGFP